MKPTSLLLLNAAALTSAHWVTSNFIFNNTITGEFEYVRKITPRVASNPPEDAETLLSYPMTEVESADLRCGRNASVAWNAPKVAKVKAGEKVGFFVGRGISVPPTMYHPGYGSGWLQKVGDGGWDKNLGDGDWYKIHQTAGRTEQSVDPKTTPLDPVKMVWGRYLSPSWNFTIPATTPPGKYLVRWEAVFPNVYDTQFYVNCAHVEVVNEGASKEPGAEYKVKIPGVYVRGQKDVYFYTYDYGLKGSLDGFVPPKPDVWEG